MMSIIIRNRTWANLRSILSKAKYEGNMKIFSFGCKIAEFVYFNDVIDEQQLYNVD